MPNAYAGRRGPTIIPAVLSGMGDSNLGSSYTAGFPNYLTLIGNARGFSIINNAQVDGIGSEFGRLAYHKLVALISSTRTVANSFGGADYINLGTNNATVPLTSAFGDDLRWMTDESLARGARVTLGTPVFTRNDIALDPRTYQADYAEEIRDIAAEYTSDEVVLFDIYARFSTYDLVNLNAIYEADGVHINQFGHGFIRDMALESANLRAFTIRGV